MALIMAFSVGLIGCSTGSNSTGSTGTDNAGTDTISADPVEFNVYKRLHTNLQQYASGNEELPFYKALAEATNTKLSFMTPPVGQEREQFNLIIASGDYPDIFIDRWTDYTGGASKALGDNVIIALNDLIEEHAPNIKVAIAQYPDAFKYVTNEAGEIYGLPIVFTDNMQIVTWGVNIRKDWLDELGLEVPDTVDEYYEALTGFKEQMGAVSPFTLTLEQLKNSRFISGAYGVSTTFYQENGVVKYGPVEDGYKEYLKTLNKWYTEGLLDRDFATIDNSTRGAKILNSEAGMSWAPSKGGVAAWNQGLQESNPNALVIGAPYASLNEGEIVKLGQANPIASIACTISSTCKDPVAAIKFLDYFFSEEGRLLLNFGIEGESYDMIDGEPIFREEIMESTDMPALSKLNMYASSPEGNGGLATIYDQRYLIQINDTTPNVTEALESWAQSSTFENEMYGIMALSEDSSRYASIMNEIETYVDELLLKFIMGQESIDDRYDEYIANIKSKGVDEATAIMQKAYDSFNK